MIPKLRAGTYIRDFWQLWLDEGNEQWQRACYGYVKKKKVKEWNEF